MNVLTEKVGPLPLVLWVVIGAGGVAVLVMVTHKSGSGQQAAQTNSVNALSPNQAEAFGTLEQQQQDVVNALTTLGQNQSALGGSLSTLSGMETQNWGNANQQFANILNGQTNLGDQLTGAQQAILAGQAGLGQQIGAGFAQTQQGITQGFNQTGAALTTIQQQQLGQAQANAGYYQALAGAMQNYYNSLNGGLQGINSNIGQLSSQSAWQYQNTQAGLNSLYGMDTNMTNWLYMINARAMGIAGKTGSTSLNNPSYWPSSVPASAYSGFS